MQTLETTKSGIRKKQLFQLRLSQSKAEMSNTSTKGLLAMLGIAKKLMNFLK
jgi:hypothetical protein